MTAALGFVAVDGHNTELVPIEEVWASMPIVRLPGKLESCM